MPHAPSAGTAPRAASSTMNTANGTMRATAARLNCKAILVASPRTAKRRSGCQKVGHFLAKTRRRDGQRRERTARDQADPAEPAAPERLAHRRAALARKV